MKYFVFYLAKFIYELMVMCALIIVSARAFLYAGNFIFTFLIEHKIIK